MTFRLALCGLLSAACLAGCTSAPKLTEPSGQWENMTMHRQVRTVIVAPGNQAFPAQVYAAPTPPPVSAVVAAPTAKPQSSHVDRVLPVSKPATTAGNTEVPQP